MYDAIKRDLRDHTRWAFAIEIAGVQQRWYSHIPPTGFGGIILDTFWGTNDIPYDDRWGLLEVGDYDWKLDIAGGVVSYQPLEIAIKTDGHEALAGDALHVLGRNGERAAGWTAKVVEDISATAVIELKISRSAPAGWAYPRLIHVDGETMRVAGFAGTGALGDEYRFTGLTRGVGNTPKQPHAPGDLLPGSTVMEHVAFWEGRYATVYAIQMRDDNRTADDWREVMVGVIDAPPHHDGKRITFRIQPLTTLLDMELGTGEQAEPFGLVPNIHRFEPGIACTTEVVLQVLHRAGAGSVDELYLFQHVLAPDGGGPVYKNWPGDGIAEANAAFQAERAGGAPGLVQLAGDAEALAVQVTDFDVDLRSVKLWAYSSYSAWPRIGEPETVAAFGQASDRARMIFGLDLGREVDGYPRREGVGLIETVRAAGQRLPVRHGEWVWSVLKNGVSDFGQAVRGAPNAFYEHGETVIVTTRGVEVPVIGFATIRVDYYDRGLQDTAQTFVRIVTSDEVVVAGVGTVYELTIHPDDIDTVPSFGDWPGLPKTRITPVTVFRGQSPAEVMLQLLEGGTGAQVNGFFDQSVVGANIADRWIDEESFESFTPADGAEEWTSEVPRGVKLNDVIESMLRSMRTAIVMRTGADGRCRMTLISLGPPSDDEVQGELTPADFGVSAPPRNDVDNRTFNRFEAQIALEAGGDRLVQIRDARGVRMAAGAAKTFKIDLRNTRPYTEADLVGEVATRLIPMAGAVFFELGAPRTTWQMQVPRSRMFFVQPGAVFRVTSPRLKDAAGRLKDDAHQPTVVRKTARLTSASMPLLRSVNSPQAMARIVAAHHGVRLAGWNASMLVTAAPTPTSVTVAANEYTALTGGEFDIDGFKVGDKVLAQPRGDQDAVDPLDPLTITALDRDTFSVTFDQAHGLVGPDFAVIVPGRYQDASEHHRQAAYYSDADGFLNADEDGVVLG